jgi:hypothetical protein
MVLGAFSTMGIDQGDRCRSRLSGRSVGTVGMREKVLSVYCEKDLETVETNPLKLDEQGLSLLESTRSRCLKALLRILHPPNQFMKPTLVE